MSYNNNDCTTTTGTTTTGTTTTGTTTTGKSKDHTDYIPAFNFAGFEHSISDIRETTQNIFHVVIELYNELDAIKAYIDKNEEDD